MNAENPNLRNTVPSSGPTPVRVWLLGKSGAGKSSIVASLLDTTHAAIGSGFRPQTQNTEVFSFPDEEAPLLEFWDTRGLDDASNSAEDDTIEDLQDRAELLLVVVDITDMEISALKNRVETAKLSRPDRPILLILTAIHRLYPGEPHSQDLVDWLEGEAGDQLENAIAAGDTSSQIAAVHRARKHIESVFSGLVNESVPIDLTQVHDGFSPPDLGSGELLSCVLKWLPQAASSRLRLSRIEAHKSDEPIAGVSKEAWPVILQHSAAATAAAATPVPGFDIAAMTSIQYAMARRIASIHRQPADASNLKYLATSIGLGLGVRALT
ncbi:MAG: GTPase domain-containing protein, partial [Planctomycetota bacterium]